MNSKIRPHYPEELARVSKHHRKTIQVLKDLVRINKDRITVYEKAAHESNGIPADTRDVLYRLATDSRAYVNELHAEVIRLGARPVTQETISGKIYLFWLDLGARLPGIFPTTSSSTALPGGTDLLASGNSDLTFLDACEHFEEAVQQVYYQALNGGDLTDEIHRLVERQLWALEWTQAQIHNLNHTL
jgi:hypothetical protein